MWISNVIELQPLARTALNVGSALDVLAPVIDLVVSPQQASGPEGGLKRRGASRAAHAR